MAIETPLHVHRINRKRELHLVHPAVARRTADTFVDVNAMIEIGKSG